MAARKKTTKRRKTAKKPTATIKASFKTLMNSLGFFAISLVNLVSIVLIIVNVTIGVTYKTVVFLKTAHGKYQESKALTVSAVGGTRIYDGTKS